MKEKKQSARNKNKNTNEQLKRKTIKIEYNY